MSEEEKFFAFIEHYGQIELVYWCKTEEEARQRIVKWKKSVLLFDPDVHYFVGQILF